MSRIRNAMYEIHEMDEMAERNSQINQLHPLAKLFVTIIYITCVVSFDKYDFIGLVPMMIYPLIGLNLVDISIKTCFRKIRVVLPVVCFIGIFNPLYDHSQIITVYGFAITGGMVSMVTLILKGLYTLMAAFLLMATTGIERLCYALKRLHVPSILVTQILLMYRYITVLMGEANSVIEAYSLRAPKEKGVRYKVWGSLLGQLLLRSIDRSEKLFDSMLLRGFHGEYYYGNRQNWRSTDTIYLIVWLFIISALRMIDLAEMFRVFL